MVQICWLPVVLQFQLPASTIHQFFAAQAPDVTSASLALKDNKAKSESWKASGDQNRN